MIGREAVYSAIDSERDHHKTIHDPFNDDKLSIADWVIFMENHINKAKQCLYDLAPRKALEEMRKSAAIAVACMEHNGAPKRK